MKNGNSFFACYSKSFDQNNTVVVEIGSQDVNGSLKDVCPKNFKYIGVDFIKANNVDLVLDDPYQLPFDDNSVDMVVSSSCFEHSEMFWLVYLEALRILKPSGLFYLNAPSRGNYHLYPVDCWRFYPDSGIALTNWGIRSGYNNVMLESYTQAKGGWGDFVAVFLKDAKYIDSFQNRILESKKDYINGHMDSHPDQVFNPNLSNNDEPILLLSLFLSRFVPKRLKSIAKKLWAYCS